MLGWTTEYSLSLDVVAEASRVGALYRGRHLVSQEEFQFTKNLEGRGLVCG